MRYFLDTEFNGFGGELISIALVPEDEGLDPFYQAIECCNPVTWVAENVIPVLETQPIARSTLADRFVDYLINDPAPVLIADWPEDIAHAAQLLIIGPGRMKPVRGISFVLVDPTLIGSGKPGAVRHNAYYDAVQLRAGVLDHERRLALSMCRSPFAADDL